VLYRYVIIIMNLYVKFIKINFHKNIYNHFIRLFNSFVGGIM